MKYREFYMDTDILDRALNSCDLGDGYSAKVRQYPHKDHIKYYTRVIEYQAYTDLKQQANMLYEVLAQLKRGVHIMAQVQDNCLGKEYKEWGIEKDIKQALKTYEDFIKESEK